MGRRVLPEIEGFVGNLVPAELGRVRRVVELRLGLRREAEHRRRGGEQRDAKQIPASERWAVHGLGLSGLSRSGSDSALSDAA